MALLIRTLVDAEDPDDVRRVNEIQDAVSLEVGNPGHFDVPDWDQASLTTVPDTLLRSPRRSAARSVPGSGPEPRWTRSGISCSTAAGWGGNPPRDATYVGVFPERNDGATVHRLRVADVPVDGFWSVTVYNREGSSNQTPEQIYSVNNLTAIRGDDRLVTVQSEARPPTACPTGCQ